MERSYLIANRHKHTLGFRNFIVLVLLFIENHDISFHATFARRIQSDMLNKENVREIRIDRIYSLDCITRAQTHTNLNSMEQLVGRRLSDLSIPHWLACLHNYKRLFSESLVHALGSTAFNFVVLETVYEKAIHSLRLWIHNGKHKLCRVSQMNWLPRHAMYIAVNWLNKRYKYANCQDKRDN